jgi:hypothetical protein
LPASDPALTPALTPAPVPAPAPGDGTGGRSDAAPAPVPAPAPARHSNSAPAAGGAGVVPEWHGHGAGGAAHPALRVVYAAPRVVAGPGAAAPPASRAAARDLRLAYAAYLLTRGFSARHAAAQCGVAPSTLGDRLRAAGNDAARLYRRMREALSADDQAVLDALITRGDERSDDFVGS